MSIRTSFSPLGGGGTAQENPNFLRNKIKNHPLVVDGEPDYSQTETTWHIYKFDTGRGDTWCYRGNADNYVRFAAGTVSGLPRNLTWRIVRLNESGSVRLITYDWLTSTYIDDYAVTFNASKTRTAMDRWFNEYTTLYRYFSGSSDDVIVDEPFLWDLSDRGYVYPYNIYDAGARLGVTTTQDGGPYPIAPKLYDSTWEPNGYAWSVQSGKISTPCGLLTGDEMVISGSRFNASNGGNSATCKAGAANQPHLFAPLTHSSVFGTNVVIYYQSTGYLHRAASGTVHLACRPVVNIRGDIEVSGTGSSSDPYILKI